MNLSIIIPTLNGRYLLEKSLPKLFNALKKIINWELIIVDNNSDDNTKEYIQSYEKINYIQLERNYGFTKAVNLGVKKAKGKYLLILNNDCFLEEDTIIKMIKFLDANNEYVATQPVVYSKDKQIENIGYIIDLWKGKAKSVTDKKHPWGVHSATPGVFERYLYGLSATCLLIKKDAFIEIGMFDESFHSYLEDVDLFIRLAKKGYEYHPTLDASCYHLHMQTSKKMGLYKEKQDLKNWIRIILKNYPPGFIIWHFPALFIERCRNLSGLTKKLIKLTYVSNITK